VTTAQLGEIASIVRGIAFPKEDKRAEPLPGHVACLRTTNVQRTVEWDDLWFVPEKHVKRDEQLVRSGDILISTANSYELVGKVAPVVGIPHKATLGAFISLIRPNERVEPKFLYHQLAWGKTQSRIRETASTTTNISNVSTKKLLTLEMFTPSLEVQREIVAELEKQFSRLDEAVANLQRVKANLKRYKASVLKAAVEGRLVETEATLARREGRTYETGQQLLQRIVGIEEIRTNTSKSSKTSEQGDCPTGWTRTSIGRISEFSFYGPRFSSDAYSDKGVFVLRTTDIDESGRVNTSTAPKIDLTAKDLAKYRVAPGDLLVTRTGSLGRVALFEDKVDAIPGAYLIQIRLRLDEHSRKFLLMFLQSPEGQARLTGGGAGVGRKNLNAPTIAAIAFGLPPRAEQARIVAEVDRHLSIIREVEAEVDANLQRAQALRQATLAKAFSSKLV
jgi:type I restriction enzyme S subunit